MLAGVIYSALAVDKEVCMLLRYRFYQLQLQPEKVIRQMSLVDGKLLVHFVAVETRFLGSSYSAFVDILALPTKTAEEFGRGTKF